jgi:hypothetical protein
VTVLKRMCADAPRPRSRENLDVIGHAHVLPGARRVLTPGGTAILVSAITRRAGPCQRISASYADAHRRDVETAGGRILPPVERRLGIDELTLVGLDLDGQDVADVALGQQGRRVESTSSVFGAGTSCVTSCGARRAASSMVRASAAFIAMRLASITCLPCSSTARVISLCVLGQVPIHTASMSGRAPGSRQSA